MRRRLGLTIGPLLLGLTTVGACSYLRTSAEAELCKAVLPAVEPAGSILVQSVTREKSSTLPTIRVDYLVEMTADAHHAGRLRCAFRESVFGQRPDIADIEVNGQRMSRARRFFLERYWLDEPQVVAEGGRRLVDRSEQQSLATP
jgi:hypothetical protein